MRRHFLYLVYGLVAYAAFQVSLLGAVGFVTGFVVPNRLDGPPRGSLTQALAIDCGLLLIFALQHSIMARRGFKERWTQIIPWALERSTYVLAASLALLLLEWQWRPLGGEIWHLQNPTAVLAVQVLAALGWAGALAVTFYINHFDLFGLRQVWLPLMGRPYAPVPLCTPLPYRMVRHPLYLCFMVAFWATPRMTLAHLLFAAGTTAYILIAIQLEERDLALDHGAAYEHYRRKVPMLLPWPRAKAPVDAKGAVAQR